MEGIIQSFVDSFLRENDEDGTFNGERFWVHLRGKYLIFDTQSHAVSFVKKEEGIAVHYQLGFTTVKTTTCQPPQVLTIIEDVLRTSAEHKLGENQHQGQKALCPEQQIHLTFRR